jgi:polar amino acid transport system substrate-binding protein
MRRTTALSLAAVALLATGLTACSADGAAPASSGSSTAAGSSEAAALLPAVIAKAGVIKVATDAHYAPMDYYEDDGTTLTGADYDMGQALGKALGVKVEVTDVAFDNIIPSLKSGQYDMAITFMTDTVARQATVDFVDAYVDGSSILVAQGNPKGIKKLTDLCGQTVVTTTTSVQNDLAKAQDATCAGLGKKPIDVINVTTDSDALLQVTSGRAVADLADSVAAAYNASTAGGGKTYEVVGDVYEKTPVGMTLPKNSKLTAAVEAGLKHLKTSGEYDRILKKWKLESLAIDEIAVNSAK